MYRKHFFFSLAVSAMLLLCSVAVFAQTGTVRGQVVLKQADGKTVPAVGAMVDIYRTDIPGKQEVKADKKGNFAMVGLFIVGKYILSASAPNARPKVIPNIKAGQQAEYTITLDPGDGRRLTVDEAKSLASNDGPADGGGGGESEETRKKREEMIAKNREIEDSNKKIEATNSTVTRTVKAGNEALNAKRYDEAIALYDEGIAADPTHPGAPVLLTNKALALTNRGVQRFNEAVKAKDEAGSAAAKKDWREATESANKAVELLKAQPAPTEAASLANYKTSTYLALSARAEAYRLFVSKADKSQANAGLTAYQELIAVETDPAKKTKAEMNVALMLFDSNDFDKAAAEYQKILTNNPDNVDALVYAGLSLINVGYTSNDKTKFQEGANYLQRFVDKAPETHALKADAKAVLENIKAQQNIKPEKPASGGRRRG